MKADSTEERKLLTITNILVMRITEDEDLENFFRSRDSVLHRDWLMLPPFSLKRLRGMLADFNGFPFLAGHDSKTALVLQSVDTSLSMSFCLTPILLLVVLYLSTVYRMSPLKTRMARNGKTMVIIASMLPRTISMGPYSGLV